MAGVDITIAGDFARFKAVGARLKETGDKGLKTEMRRGITKAAKPLQTDVKTSIPQYMPSGYAPVLQGALRLRTSNAASGVRITATGKGRRRPREVRRMDEGVLRHPVFGRYKDLWVNQRIRPGFFREPLERGADKVRAELGRVLDEIAAKLGG